MDVEQREGTNNKEDFNTLMLRIARKGYAQGLTLDNFKSEPFSIIQERYPDACPIFIVKQGTAIFKEELIKTTGYFSGFVEGELSRILNMPPRIDRAIEYARSTVDHEMEHVNAAKELGVEISRFGFVFLRDSHNLPGFYVRVNYNLEEELAIYNLYITTAPNELSAGDIVNSIGYLKESLKKPTKTIEQYKRIRELGYEEKLRQNLLKLFLHIIQRRKS